MSTLHAIPRPVIERMVLYLRQCQRLEREGIDTVSSTELGEAIGASSAQVRKDLSFFGQFGQRGLGYPVQNLERALRPLLALDREWKVALVGAGNIGRALCTYRTFRERGFQIVALFDSDPRKEGCTWARLKVLPMSSLRRTVAELGIELGIIAVPVEAAQNVADQLVAAGVKGVLNFAPTHVTVPSGVAVRSVDLAVELEQLAFLVTRSSAP
ncbi:MAG TPA: redox-sensing transcriptional repressor Rex [Planctomycetota bacterium]|nr:redox-sensing transcriptional repressor Rex [Planctomycetota bacterium]HRR79704.1 redox-sensing transcriptional repressor Rex [Planctomycetota bacterium]HRT97553.1 redox-sensing transcriptional repressor Rex [Planctomycetota bacterium]